MVKSFTKRLLPILKSKSQSQVVWISFGGIYHSIESIRSIQLVPESILTLNVTLLVETLFIQLSIWLSALSLSFSSDRPLHRFPQLSARFLLLLATFFPFVALLHQLAFSDPVSTTNCLLLFASRFLSAL